MSGGDFRTACNPRPTEFAELAAAFNRMSEKLEQLDRSRNQFVSNASHELKTPLSTMKILIETIMYQDPFDPGMTREFLTDVNKEIDRLNRIVRPADAGQYRQRRHEAAPERFASGRDAAETVKRLAPLAGNGGILSWRRTPRPSSTATSKLQQVLYNVIDNAIKYTPRAATCASS